MRRFVVILLVCLTFVCQTKAQQLQPEYRAYLDSICPRPLLALKTNLLYDAALAPNIEIEVPLGRQSQWSVMAEYWQPWYVWHHNTRAYQIQTLGFELRYWTYRNSQRHYYAPFEGGFWGIYCQTGKYDLEWSSKGYQGEFVSAGLTVGYDWRISHDWRLEASASLGPLWGPQRYYKGEFDDTHLIWHEDRNLFYIGPTKLKVSIVWMMPNFLKRRQQTGRKEEVRP